MKKIFGIFIIIFVVTYCFAFATELIAEDVSLSGENVFNGDTNADGEISKMEIIDESFSAPDDNGATSMGEYSETRESQINRPPKIQMEEIDVEDLTIQDEVDETYYNPVNHVFVYLIVFVVVILTLIICAMKTFR